MMGTLTGYFHRQKPNPAIVYYDPSTSELFDFDLYFIIYFVFLMSGFRNCTLPAQYLGLRVLGHKVYSFEATLSQLYFEILPTF